jgi:hypothetical protein
MDVYGIPEVAIHNPADEDWLSLPRECVLQLHWHRTPSFLRLLEEAGFQVVTLMRHPLDILLSVLQFCQHDRSTLRWLDGEGGNERPIHGAMPGSQAFADYATGPRAATLLSVSLQWWQDPGACRVRFEDLIADPSGELDRIVQAMGVPPRQPPAKVANSTTMAGLRARFRAEHHFWQGRPGLWKALLTAPAAARIAHAHAAAFACGYSCDPDPDLTPAQADANWVNLVGSLVADKLYSMTRTTQRLADAHDAIEHLQEQIAYLDESLQQTQDRLNSACAELKEVREAHRAAAAELDNFRQLGPLALGIARTLHNLSRRHRTLSAGAKWAVWLVTSLAGIVSPLRRE